MAINFPSSPSTDDEHTVGNITYIYDGTSWITKTFSSIDFNTETGTGAVSKTILPNQFYDFTTTALTSLTITLGTPISGIMNEYMFQFLSPATPATLTAIAGISWLNGTPEIAASMTYQVSIFNGIGIIAQIDES